MSRPTIHIVCIFLALLLLRDVSAQIQLDSIGINKLNGGLKAMAKDDGLVHATWGFCLMDPTTGRVVSSYERNKSLVPASSNKVIATVAALNILGADYRYNTYIEYDGVIGPDSVLSGNLYIRGTGDPSLGSTRIDSLVTYDSLLHLWAIQVKEKGISAITGNIIADASAFEDYTTVGSWNWDDIGQYYGAGASGLNFAENTYTLYYSSTGSKAQIDSIRPEIDGLIVWNDVKVGGSGDEAYIYGAPDNYYRYVTGTIPANRKGYAVDGSMPDPPLFLALAFKQALVALDIEVGQQATTVYAMKRAGIPVNKQRKVIYTHRSAPLSEIVKWTNLKSNNLYAESLLKTIGLKQSGDGSRSAGAKAVEQYYALAGIDMSGMHVEDGSGLSRLNYFTPETMCHILRHQIQQPTFAPFLNSLPIAGRTGTLKTFADKTVAEGRVFAKSGSMYKVRSYSGYVKSKSGELLTFCVMVNNYSCGSAEIKSMLEKLMVLMAGV